MQLQPIRDQEIQKYLQSSDVSQPQLKCPSHNQITNVCTNPCCHSNSLHCCENSCLSCNKSHQACEHVKLQALTKLIQARADTERELMMRLYEAQDRMIASILKQREMYALSGCLRALKGKNKRIYEQLFLYKRNYFVEGKYAADFLKELKKLTYQINANTEHEQKAYEVQLQNIQQYLRKQKQRILRDSLEARLQACSKPKGLLVDSTIIHPTDIDSIEFIRQQLKQPSNLKLLYRASEHGFLANKFHQYCNDVPNTFTIIRTEFGRTIAGFTPLTWNSASHLSFAKDPSKSSFLLSIDLKQRMQLQEEGKAIYCHSERGPCFGGGCDIYIGDKCDVSQESYADFPTSYNFKNPYKNCQDSYKSFSGAVDGCGFRVIQYEVFEVSWSQPRTIEEGEKCIIY